MRRLAALAAALLTACGGPPPEPPQVAGAAAAAEFMHGADWPSYNRDLAGTRFSPLRQISATNVDELRQAWSYPLGGGDGALEGSELTPLVVDSVLYATAADRVVALRADTGEEVWRFALAQGAPSQRGLAYWPGDDATPARIFFTAGRTLVGLDAATGQKAARVRQRRRSVDAGELQRRADAVRGLARHRLERLARRRARLRRAHR